MYLKYGRALFESDKEISGAEVLSEEEYAKQLAAAIETIKHRPIPEPGEEEADTADYEAALEAFGV